jgi:hypothetical protein
MLTIVISACLAQAPATCKDYRIPLEDGETATSCMMHAPPHLAKWADEHPNLIIAKFVCRPSTDKDI